MGFKFTLSKTKTASEAPVSQLSQPQIALPKEDWAEKTASAWSEHSGFLEKSGLINLAPPPRLDPRTVPRPDASMLAPSGPSPRVKNFAIGFVLALGVGFGLYSNGVLNGLLKPYGLGVGDEIANAPGATLKPIALRAAAVVGANTGAQTSGAASAGAQAQQVGQAPNSQAQQSQQAAQAQLPVNGQQAPAQVSNSGAQSNAQVQQAENVQPVFQAPPSANAQMQPNVAQPQPANPSATTQPRLPANALANPQSAPSAPPAQNAAMPAMATPPPVPPQRH